MLESAKKMLLNICEFKLYVILVVQFMTVHHCMIPLERITVTTLKVKETKCNNEKRCRFLNYIARAHNDSLLQGIS